MNELISILPLAIAIVMAIGVVYAAYKLVEFLLSWLSFAVKYTLWRLNVYGLRLRLLAGKIMKRSMKQIAADLIHDALFEAVHRGEMSMADCKRLCSLIGKACDNTDLLPKRWHKRWLMHKLSKGMAGPNNPEWSKASGERVKQPTVPKDKWVSKGLTHRYEGSANVVPHSEFLAKLEGKKVA